MSSFFSIYLMPILLILLEISKYTISFLAALLIFDKIKNRKR